MTPWQGTRPAGRGPGTALSGCGTTLGPRPSGPAPRYPRHGTIRLRHPATGWLRSGIRARLRDLGHQPRSPAAPGRNGRPTLDGRSRAARPDRPSRLERARRRSPAERADLRKAQVTTRSTGSPRFPRLLAWGATRRHWPSRSPTPGRVATTGRQTAAACLGLAALAWNPSGRQLLMQSARTSYLVGPPLREVVSRVCRVTPGMQIIQVVLAAPPGGDGHEGSAGRGRTPARWVGWRLWSDVPLSVWNLARGLREPTLARFPGVHEPSWPGARGAGLPAGFSGSPSITTSGHRRSDPDVWSPS